MNSHKELSEQSTKYSPLLSKNIHLLFFVRLTGLLVMSFNVLLFFYNCGLTIVPFKFFTIWGMFLTFICFAAGTWNTMHQNDTSFNESQKYNPLKAWKWHVFLFEVAFSFQVVITVVFWTILWPTTSKEPRFQEPVRRFALIFDHVAPIILLTLDYIINATPVIGRHIYVLGTICMFY